MTKIQIILLIISLFFAFNLFGYQHSFLNLVSPSELQDLQTEVGISHRFNGPYDDRPLDNAFGMDLGANIGIQLRQALMYKTELKLGYIRTNHESVIEISNRFTPDAFPVQAAANLQHFSYRDPFDYASRHDNLMLLLAVQNKPVFDMLSMNVNLGYDMQHKRLVNGFGIGLKPVDNITLIGEYYPVGDRKSAPKEVKDLLGKYNCFAMGVKLDTYGHHFMFMLSNNDSMAPRELSMGTYVKKDLKLGFNIQRQMNFF